MLCCRNDTGCCSVVVLVLLSHMYRSGSSSSSSSVLLLYVSFYLLTWHKYATYVLRCCLVVCLPARLLAVYQVQVPVRWYSSTYEFKIRAQQKKFMFFGVFVAGVACTPVVLITAVRSNAPKTAMCLPPCRYYSVSHQIHLPLPECGVGVLEATPSFLVFRRSTQRLGSYGPRPRLLLSRTAAFSRVHMFGRKRGTTKA